MKSTTAVLPTDVCLHICVAAVSCSQLHFVAALSNLLFISACGGPAHVGWVTVASSMVWLTWYLVLKPATVSWSQAWHCIHVSAGVHV